ncbi:hypothetical protein T459_17208 [Capsicum annuum]|uniref:Endonuclease/exonuclease/phosphatase domain-containing protein n=1 Tax=Capsicum annuum TaxID=4072 RepID=A0A2G2ZAX5_CAPAN|nr:hypothetical protein T459_17208 [Capsicum annuum]
MSFLIWNIIRGNKRYKQKKLNKFLKAHHIRLAGLIETRVKGNNMHRIANCIAPGWEILHNYSDASNGRIWLIWDQNYYDLQKLKTFAQLVHRLVQNRRKGHQFLITVIYGFNTMELRRTLWDELEHIAPGVNQPWLIAGEFNALLNPRDRQAGAPVTPADTQEFADCVRNVGIYELP